MATAPGSVRLKRGPVFWAIWSCGAVVVLTLGVRAFFAVMGVFVPSLDEDYLRPRIVDQLYFREFLATEHALEEMLVARWRTGDQQFTLAEVLPISATRACLRVERMRPARHFRDASALLAEKSIRPWWWAGVPQSSTLVVETKDGVVRAFRLVGTGMTYLGMGTRLQFEFFLGTVFACGEPRELILSSRRPADGTPTFFVLEIRQN